MNRTPSIELSNPFPGLRPFREDEEHLFFGRESQIDMMVDKLAGTHFLVVIGTSGSGKSSLVNCGLRPALHRGLMAEAGTSWRMAQFRPGSNPSRALACALAKEGVLFNDFDSGNLTMEDMLETVLRMSKLGLLDLYEQAQLGEGVNLLVVVDQFEELFRYRVLGTAAAGDEQDRSQEAAAFVNLLLEPKGHAKFPIYVVLTMRSDFLGDCAKFPGLPEAINEGQYLVPRMTRTERKAAIAGPVGVGGGCISSVLLTRLVNDVGDNPDQLSILQHALNRTWTRWQHEGRGEGALDLPHYEAIGTMAHALDEHAEKAYGDLGSERQRKICEKIFKALTDKGTDARGIRRPTKLGTLCTLADASQAEVTQVIDIFRKPSRSFLMPPPQETLDCNTVIDISHESLMRVWERLKVWANEEAQSAALYRRVMETATLHAAGKAGLWRDPDLQLTLEWREKEKPTKAWAELLGGGFQIAMGFLVESEAQRDREVRDKEEQQRRELEQAQALAAEQQRRAKEQARSASRMRQLAFSLAAVSLLAGLASIFALNQSKKATREKRLAVSRELGAAAAENLYRDPQLSILLALKAADIFRKARESVPSEIIDVISRAVLTSRERVFINVPGRAKVVDLAFTRDGQRLTTIDSNGTVAVWDAESGDKIALPPAHEGAKALSGDSRLLASVSDGKTRVWETASGKRLLETVGESGAQAVSAFFSPDATRLAVANSDSTVEVWDLKLTKAVLRFKSRSGPVQFIAFDPLGKRLATGSAGGATELWDASSGRELQQLEDHGSKVLCVAFSPDGQRLVRSSNDHTVCLWDLSSRKEPRYLNPIRSQVLRVAFSSNGQLLATAGADDTARVWDGTGSSGRLLFVLDGHKNVVSSIAFSPDGQRAATASWDGTIRIWDVVAPHLQDVQAISFSHDGTRVASVSKEGRVKLWDPSLRILLTFPEQRAAPLTSVSFSPDDKRLATGSADGTVALWETSSGKQLFQLKEESPVSDVAFSSDGTRLATGTADGMARVWELSSRAVVHRLTGHRAPVWCIAYSQDGRLLATGSLDRTAKVWDIDSEKAILTTDPYDNEVTAVAFSPDGSRLAISSLDGSAMVGEIANWHESRRPLTGHTMGVMSIVFNRDGTLLATASSDRTARVWDFAGHELLKFTHGAGVTDLDFSPDGRQLATGSEDGTVHVMPLDPKELLQLARSRVTRRLVTEECEKYLHSACPEAAR